MTAATNSVWCEECMHCMRRLDGKELPAYRWMCARAPRDDRENFVSHLMRLTPPYYTCATVNHDGSCPMFEARRESAHV
jgi:hypothetical protein